MLSSIKTPGVYINEVNAFPPSVAQVATAIPAFIGFTEKGPEDQPTRITSMLEFESIFGGAPKPDNITIDIGNGVFNVTESMFKMYGSLRLFYANGGGICYIVSTGHYEDTATITSATPFEEGIAALERFDEPTLLLFPDAVNLDAAVLGNVQKAALSQCQELMDRFTIMDVKQEGSGLEADMTAFRSGVGTRSLKYGAGYYPYLKASFGFTFRFMDIHQVSGYDFKVAQPALIPAIDSFIQAHTDAATLASNWEGFTTAKEKPDSGTLPIDDLTKVNAYATKSWTLLDVLSDPTSIANAALQAEVTEMIKVSLVPLAQKLVDLEAKVDAIDAAYNIQTDAVDNDFNNDAWKDGNADFIPSATNPFDNQISTDGDTTISFPLLQAQLDKIHTDILNTLDSVMASVDNYITTEENNLTPQLQDWPQIVAGLSQTMNTLPPSGAMAGIYASTDATRGVWKAPANISVNGIIDLTDDITHKEQENMNIHETGKSVNAIRKFTGQGMLVWGARTLDGNSNDWRYISVRRLANMIEESAKKASRAFVFEPNVKQTWVNIKGMLENYLTTLWSDGALAGAKPADAFFVSVGLNETMSPTDINEGRLIVKIGYAPSRPAEFIILEFTQTQQRS